MAPTPSQISDHVSRVRISATKIIDAFGDLSQLEMEWIWFDLYSILTDEDCQGLTKEEVAAIYITLAALKIFMSSGHGTNLVRLRIG